MLQKKKNCLLNSFHYHSPALSRKVIIHHNRKTSHISWRLRRTVKKMVRVNLLGMLNAAVTKPIKACLKPPKEDRRRSKLMSEFHLTPEKVMPNSCHDLSLNSSTLSDVQYIDLSSPEFVLHSETSVREQILNYSKKLIEQESEQFTPIQMDLSSSFKQFQDYDLVPMTHGAYLNFGITNNIKRILGIKTNQRQLRDYSYPVVLKMDVVCYVQKVTQPNGIKIARHLLVLGRISNAMVLAVTEPFVIGVYEGAFPEANVCNEILRPFVDEVRILENGYELDGRQFRLQLGTFICDPVANSLVTCSTLPNSIYGCNKCNQKTTLHEGTERISYSGQLSASDQRSDDDYRYYLPVDHFTGASLLSQLNIGMVSQFVTDYKHVVCLGVMKHLMKCWTQGKLDYRLNKNTMKTITEKLRIVASNPPMEFQRQIRALDRMGEWEAYDWKMFLLYYGPLILKTHLPEAHYMNFLYLHLAMRIMTSAEYKFTTNECSSYIAGQLISTFVTTFKKLYGQELINHSVHYLLHFEDIFMKMGSLEGVSGFEFSKQLKALKKSLRFDSNFDELANHINDSAEASLQNAENSHVPTYGPVVNEKEELRLNNCTITTTGNDNIVITNSGVLQVDRIQKAANGDVYLHARRFQKNVVVYQAPTTHQKLIVLGTLTQKPSKYDLKKFTYLFKGAKFETGGKCTFLHPLTVY